MRSELCARCTPGIGFTICCDSSVLEVYNLLTLKVLKTASIVYMICSMDNTTRTHTKKERGAKESEQKWTQFFVVSAKTAKVSDRREVGLLVKREGWGEQRAAHRRRSSDIFPTLNRRSRSPRHTCSSLLLRRSPFLLLRSTWIGLELCMCVSVCYFLRLTVRSTTITTTEGPSSSPTSSSQHSFGNKSQESAILYVGAVMCKSVKSPRRRKYGSHKNWQFMHCIKRLHKHTLYSVASST